MRPDAEALDAKKKEWIERGLTLAHNDNLRQFEVGDWLIDGVEKWTQGVYEDALKIFTGYRQSTLRNLASVSRRVDLSLRNDKLSWAHHKAVARFGPDRQKELLTKAAEEDLTLLHFHEHIAEAYPPPAKPKPELSHEERRYERLKEALNHVYFLYERDYGRDASREVSNEKFRAEMHADLEKFLSWRIETHEKAKKRRQKREEEDQRRREELKSNPRTSIERDIISAGRRALAAKMHPDKGGDTAVMADINAAADRLEHQADRGF
jgi:hypothetical protein